MCKNTHREYIPTEKQREKNTHIERYTHIQRDGGNYRFIVKKLHSDILEFQSK